MKKLVLTGLAAVVASSAWALVGTIRTETDARKGEIKWQPRTKSYLVAITTKGGGSSNLEYPLKDVVGLDIEKPKNFDRLVEHEFKGRTWAWVDPLKDIAASRIAVEPGWKTNEEITSEYGGADFLENCDRLKLENEAKSAAGIGAPKENAKGENNAKAQ